ncbi:Astacin (Peptidase family M12A) [Pseudomonas sp. GM78]|uniref:M12 family metallopeptidase n=1 Tax=Pseudomonas sp. GM78 TaxID=1144337 RepID=UPI000270C0E7|nr:M12 family metallopeptidase [Pseudomonas sp. GM78]EJN30294.1 Astacin (Peptidase family M12A) [Pseudomonas sp. GM78]
MDTDELHICGGLPPVDIDAAYDTTPEYSDSDGGMRIRRAFGLPSVYWPEAIRLKIGFLESDPELEDLFKSAVAQWTPHINLSIEYVINLTQADIRVAFGACRDGHWSRVGTDALTVPIEKPTMQIDFKEEHSDEIWIAIILHEFGHALGLQHEHQHPDANIDWHTPKVYKICKERHGWSEDTTRSNIFRKHKNIKALGPYDQTSIMHYGFGKAFIWKGTAIPRPLTLSEKDKELISSIYPPHLRRG